MAMAGPPKKPLHFVLVHGFGSGAWCWYKLRSLMETSGYKVSCIDLKSAGIDPTDLETILSFDEYNQPLTYFMSALPDDEQVILVGHSAGGLSVTQAIHKFAKKIRMVIYEAATMLKFGFQTDEDRRIGIPDSSKSGDDTCQVQKLGSGLEVDQPPATALVKTELEREIHYTTPPEDLALVELLYKGGPSHAIKNARFVEESEEFDRVERVYIKTKYDSVLKPWQQDAMIKRWPPSQVYALPSDHIPQSAAPFLLFQVLVKATSALL